MSKENPAVGSLFEYVWDGQERTDHMWLTENEYKAVDWVLRRDAGIFASIRSCPDDCSYRDLPRNGVSTAEEPLKIGLPEKVTFYLLEGVIQSVCLGHIVIYQRFKPPYLHDEKFVLSTDGGFTEWKSELAPNREEDGSDLKSGRWVKIGQPDIKSGDIFRVTYTATEDWFLGSQEGSAGPNGVSVVERVEKLYERQSDES